MANPNWKKGVSGNPSGRRKGARNKFTTLKAAFVNAFQKLGGEEALLEWIKENDLKSGERKKEFFKMVATMLPRDIEVSGKEGQPINVIYGHRDS
jgi:hypothetical protein